jgi:hypothetical protein
MIGASTNEPSCVPFLKAWMGQAVGSRGRTYHLILKGHAFGIVVRKPSFRGVGIREDLEVIGVSDLLTSVDIDQHGHWSLLSFRLQHNAHYSHAFVRCYLPHMNLRCSGPACSAGP